jgi:hypothetical protein
VLWHRFECIENEGSCRLNVLEARQKQIRVSTVETDVVATGGTRIYSNRAANHVSHGFRFGLADAFVSIGSAITKVHVGVRDFMN